MEGKYSKYFGYSHFISSANLTGYAMDRNMEAGVLIQGGDLPDRLHRHLEALVKTGVITPAFGEHFGRT